MPINNIIVSPFLFWPKEGYPKAVFDDPWRFRLKIIGIPEEVQRWVQESVKTIEQSWKEMASKTKRGESVVIQIPEFPFGKEPS